MMLEGLLLLLGFRERLSQTHLVPMMDRVERLQEGTTAERPTRLSKNPKELRALLPEHVGRVFAVLTKDP